MGQFQPAVFTGTGSTNDHRVGIFWYLQRWSAFGDADPRQRWTSVEGVISTDAGRTYGPALAMSLPVPDVASVLPAVPGQGVVFVPCQASGSRYFGDYNGGVFLTDDPKDRTSSSAWADSREGCPEQATGAFAPHQHQHVFSAVWGPGAF